MKTDLNLGDVPAHVDLLVLMQEVFSIAEHGCLLDGDEVNTPTRLWAEEWRRKISGLNAPVKPDPTQLGLGS